MSKAKAGRTALCIMAQDKHKKIRSETIVPTTITLMLASDSLASQTLYPIKRVWDNRLALSSQQGLSPLTWLRHKPRKRGGGGGRGI